jgi:predicted RNase H-like HicB family nuclease
MLRTFTLDYWEDDGWYVGKLRGVPGVFSQGKTLEELENNIREVYSLMMADEKAPAELTVQTKEIGVEV